MKNYLLLFSIICAISSCTVEKRLYNSGLNVQWRKVKNTETQNIDPITEEESFSIKEIETSNKISSVDQSDNIRDNLNQDIEKNEVTSSIEKETPKADSKNEPNCDLMTLKSGEEISVKILEIGTEEIKYKNCDNLDGPIISIKKQDVFMIKYPNGKKDIIKSSEPTENPVSKSTEKETNGMAMASFIIGLLGVIPILSIVLGIIAKNQILKQPEKYKGEGLATAGILLGILWIFVGIIFILLLA